MSAVISAFASLGKTMETHQVKADDTRPCAQVLPVHAIPNVAVLLYADTLEEWRTAASNLRDTK